MGILRADRITGLGGANAIKGSVFFPQNSYIDVSPDSGFDLSGDFNIGSTFGSLDLLFSSKKSLTVRSLLGFVSSFGRHPNSPLV